MDHKSIFDQGDGHRDECDGGAGRDAVGECGCHVRVARPRVAERGDAAQGIAPAAWKDQGDPRYRRLLDEIWDLHCRKMWDYGRAGDPFANVRGSSAYGVTPWVGAMIRANDKVVRIQQFIAKGVLANESLRDAFVDLAAYALIATVLYDESVKEGK